ncbi:MAG: hypothetical protein V4592_24365 [Bacteroidota bacterium]
MKLIGFIKEHDDLPEAKRFDDFFNKTATEEDTIRQKIIQYLEGGELVVAWMGYNLHIETQQPLCPASYLTDGTWVWPNYFIQYLKEYPRMTIDDNFLKYIESNNFVNPAKNNVSTGLRDFENDLMIKLNERKSYEKGQKLIDVVKSIENIDDSLVIFQRGKIDIHSGIVLIEDERVASEGTMIIIDGQHYFYLLEVAVVKEFINDFVSSLATKPSDNEITRRLFDYAINDA